MEESKLITEEMLEYLDILREKGSTNMFGAGPYLVRRFGLTTKESHEVLGHWMKTFSTRNKS